jgi:hypothetical protein
VHGIPLRIEDVLLRKEEENELQEKFPLLRKFSNCTGGGSNKSQNSKLLGRGTGRFVAEVDSGIGGYACLFFYFKNIFKKI